MNKIKKSYQNSLFFITILFFLLSIVNISLAALGIVCFIIPFVQYAIYKDKVWCKFYCPRAGLFNRLLSKISLKKKLPKFMTGNRIKKGVLIYFCINMFFVIMSTIMVSIGRIAPLEELRLLIIFRVPIVLPQLMYISAPDFIVHFGYRIYSVMLTSTIVGLILGFIYRPRTWCIICPVQTITSIKPKVK